MFGRRRRRRSSPIKIAGLILLMVGVLMLVYIIPSRLWYFIISCLFIMIGLFIYKIS